MATDEFFRFKVTDSLGLSFMIVIHRKKSVIDLYEEVDLRINGTSGENYIRLSGLRDNPNSELEFGRDTLENAVGNMAEDGMIVEIDQAPSILEIHLIHEH